MIKEVNFYVYQKVLNKLSNIDKFFGDLLIISFKFQKIKK